MTLTDMMLMILGISGNSGIWEPLFQAVNEWDWPEAALHVFIFHLRCRRLYAFVSVSSAKDMQNELVYIYKL